MRRAEILVPVGLLAAAVIAAYYFVGFAYLPIFMFVGAAIPVLGALDAALQPESAWAAADQNKIVWVGIQLGGILVMFVPGFLAAIAYFALIRPKLRTRSPLA